MKIKYSWDYEDLIEEFKEELDDKTLTYDDEVYIVRGEKIEEWNYRPIIDWYYIDDDYGDDEVEKMRVFEVMAEMVMKDKIL